MFLTGMAANPLVGNLAKSALGVEVTWVGWFTAAIVPGLVCFFLMPLLVYKILNPDLKRAPEVKKMGRRSLSELGPMTRTEKKVAFGFVLALIGWCPSLLTGLGATTVGLGLAAYLFATAIAVGAPPMMVAICFGIFSNLMWGNTEYGGGPGPIYFAQGYFERPRFYTINFFVVTFNVILTFTVGAVWWKVLGYY